MMKKHTTFGKVIGWLGFLFFMLGFTFNGKIGVISDAPENLAALSVPGIIIGIVLMIISNFFRRKN
jgi:hypothetical protein